MDAGFFTSAVGMLDGFNIENNIADNLANLQTPGYKERSAIQDSFTQALTAAVGDPMAGEGTSDVPIGRFSSAPMARQFGLNLAQGSAQYTGSPLDLMVAGNGFFTVRTPSGVALTRNGSFHRSDTGTLVTHEGYAVLDSAGQPIKVGGDALAVDRRGEVSVAGKPVALLGLVQVPAGRALTELGGGYYSGPSQPVAARGAGTAIVQGYLEGSNVDMATATTAMMSAQRAYQANSRMMQMQDDTMSLAVNNIGKVSA